MKLISTVELSTLLAAVRGASFATIIAETDPKLRKTGNPYVGVRKVSRVNVCIGFQYEAAVNRQREREGSSTDFEARPRQWGERVKGTVLVEHKGRQYLETKIERTFEHTYFDASGRQLTDADVAPFLPARGASRQDVEKEILVRDYALESIRAISFKGENYVVMHEGSIVLPQATLASVAS